MNLFSRKAYSNFLKATKLRRKQIAEVMKVY